MDNLHPAQSAETKKFLEEECGLQPWKPTREPNYCNPDKMECKSAMHAAPTTNAYFITFSLSFVSPLNHFFLFANLQ